MSLAPNHPRASVNKSVLTHILIAEKALGKYLPAGAEVHHVDMARQNNANANLVICQDRHYHALLHRRAVVVKAGGDPNTQRFCRLCSRVQALSEFPTDMSIADGHRSYCRHCQSAMRRRYYNEVEKTRSKVSAYAQ